MVLTQGVTGTAVSDAIQMNVVLHQIVNFNTLLTSYDSYRTIYRFVKKHPWQPVYCLVIFAAIKIAGDAGIAVIIASRSRLPGSAFVTAIKRYSLAQSKKKTLQMQGLC